MKLALSRCVNEAVKDMIFLRMKMGVVYVDTEWDTQADTACLMSAEEY